MYAIWDSKRRAFKTYDGWTQYVKDKNGERIDGMADVIRFTEGERAHNALPPRQTYVHVNGPISWNDLK